MGKGRGSDSLRELLALVRNHGFSGFDFGRIGACKEKTDQRYKLISTSFARGEQKTTKTQKNHTKKPTIGRCGGLGGRGELSNQFQFCIK